MSCELRESLFTGMLLLFALRPTNAADVAVEHIRFAPGSSAAIVQGSLAGDRIVDYRLRASAGQSMQVVLESSNTANYFNVMAPGETEVAFFIGSIEGNRYLGVLPATGDYTIRVYLMRSAARRNESARYTLNVGINGEPLGTPPATDARVAGTPYHATGSIQCSIEGDGAREMQCDYGVIRGNSGQAVLHLTAPRGAKRSLRFSSSGVSAADPATRIQATHLEDNWIIVLDGTERYVVPDAAIDGG